MPQISRIRYVNLGHDNARMEDLILDLRDGEGQPTDTALWLDNGGGKSSMLSLFFSMVRPGLRDFLGARAEQRLRRLEDYVRPSDRSLILGEWKLDQAAGDLFSDVTHLITGVFIERGSGSGEESRLERTFFAFHSIPGTPGLTLEGAPVYEDGITSGTRRWTKAGFKVQLAQLRDHVPLAQVYVTDSQSEWQRYLDHRGIDTELFLYQIQMNQREGGASEIFKFRDVEEFVDFFVRVVLGDEAGAELGETLATYRRELKDRRERLLPERGLVEGLADRFRRIAEVGARRHELGGKIARIAAQIHRTHAYIDDFRSRRSAEAEAAEHEAEAATEEARKLRDRSDERAARATIVQHLTAAKQLREAEKRDLQAQDHFDEVTRQRSIADLAIPLSRANRYRREAESLEAQLQMARSSHAPLLERVREAATAYAGALGAAIVRVDGRIDALRDQADDAERHALERRERSKQWEIRAADLEAQARALAEQRKQAGVEARRLVQQGAAGEGESPTSARKRWAREIEDSRTALIGNQERFEQLQASEREHRARAEDLRDEVRNARQEIALAHSALEKASQERRALERDELILESIRSERIDLDTMDDAVLARVGQAAEREESALFELWSEEAATQRVLRRLDESGLLPPSRDAERVIALLAPRLEMAVSGWEYAASVFSVASGAAREFVERHPHLATGVIVRDEDFETARTLLREESIEVSEPIVVAPQRAAHSASVLEGCVLTPSSDAHFDTEAGEVERTERRAMLERIRRTVDERKRMQKAFYDRVARLQSFRERYAAGHFAREASRIEQLEALRSGRTERLQELEASLARIREEIAAVRDLREQLHNRIATAERAQDRVEAFLRRFGDDPEARESERMELLVHAKELRADAEAATQAAVEADARAKQCRDEVATLSAERGALQRQRDDVTEVDEVRLEEVAGDIGELRDRYVQLRAQYNSEVNESGLEQMRARAVREMQQEASRFDVLLRDLLRKRDSRLGEIFQGVKPEVIRTEAEAWIAALSDPDRIEEKRDDLINEQNVARGALSFTTTAVKKAKEDLEVASRMREQLTLTPKAHLGEDGVPTSVEELLLWLDAEQELVAAERLSVAEQKHIAEQRSRAAEFARGEAARYGLHGEKLEAIAEAARDLLARVQIPASPEPGTDPVSEAALSTKIAHIQQELQAVRLADEQLDADCDEIYQSVHLWTRREPFEKVVIGHPMIRNILARTAAACEREAPTWVEQLEVRLAAIEKTIEAVDVHRRDLIGQALAAAEKGIQALQAAEQHSRMPAHMPRFGGKRFLRIKHRTPDAEQERHARIAGLVDEIIDGNAAPSGLEIVQQAVRRLGRPFNIDVLFPDQLRGAWYTPVERLGKDSGGELLTSCILLYCNLAQLRARQRGRQASRTTVLLLDNPLGIASKLSFLEVQLEVARAAGVQLVYTTGVKDYDAISLFPNVNRLRPAGFDQRYRQWLLARTEVLLRGDGMDMARMVRSSAPEAAPTPVPT